MVVGTRPRRFPHATYRRTASAHACPDPDSLHHSLPRLLPQALGRLPQLPHGDHAVRRRSPHPARSPLPQPCLRTLPPALPTRDRTAPRFAAPRVRPRCSHPGRPPPPRGTPQRPRNPPRTELRGVTVALRTVSNLLDRYDELCGLATADPKRLGPLLRQQGRVVLAVDGLQPDVGHEVLGVLRLLGVRRAGGRPARPLKPFGHSKAVRPRCADGGLSALPFTALNGTHRRGRIMDTPMRWRPWLAALGAAWRVSAAGDPGPPAAYRARAAQGQVGRRGRAEASPADREQDAVNCRTTRTFLCPRDKNRRRIDP